MWSNILGVSVRVFLEDINIWIARLSKSDFSPWCGYDPMNLMRTKGWVRDNSLSGWVPLNWNASLLRSSDLVWTRTYIISPPISQTFRLRLELYMPLTPGSSACKSWDFLPSILSWASSLLSIYIPYLFIFLLVLFLWRTLRQRSSSLHFLWGLPQS